MAVSHGDIFHLVVQVVRPEPSNESSVGSVMTDGLECNFRYGHKSVDIEGALLEVYIILHVEI